MNLAKNTNLGMLRSHTEITNNFTQVSDRNGNPGSLADAEWSIALQQFIATTLTGQPIVDFFSQKVDIVEAVSKMRGRRFTTIHTLADPQ